MLGGMGAGLVCAWWMWDQHAYGTMLGVTFLATSLGTILGTVSSWALPSSRREMRVIREREAAAEAVAVAEELRTTPAAAFHGSGDDAAGPGVSLNDMSFEATNISQERSTRYVPKAEAPQRVTRFVAPTPPSPQGRGLKIDRVQRSKTSGEQQDLIKALLDIKKDEDK